MSLVTISIEYRILAGENCNQAATKMVSVYELDEQNYIRSERPIYTECPEIRELVCTGDLTEGDCNALRPGTVSSYIGALKSALMKAIQNNDCRQGGIITITNNGRVTTLQVNNKEDCVKALKELNRMLPTYRNYVPMYEPPRSLMTTAFDSLRSNAVPFVLGAAVVLGVAAKLRNS